MVLFMTGLAGAGCDAIRHRVGGTTFESGQQPMCQSGRQNPAHALRTEVSGSPFSSGTSATPRPRQTGNVESRETRNDRNSFVAREKLRLDFAAASAWIAS
jgi:hypothetical protein